VQASTETVYLIFGIFTVPSYMEGVLCDSSSKKGSKLDASNYRGISKLSAIPKRFENVIIPHLQHLCRSIISPCQHGFMKRRLTTTNLLELTSFVIQGFKNNLQRDVIYTDFSKAFDSVNHYLLVRKLDPLSFPVDLLNWISSYLNGRTQQVLFKNSLSCEVEWAELFVVAANSSRNETSGIAFNWLHFILALVN